MSTNNTKLATIVQDLASSDPSKGAAMVGFTQEGGGAQWRTVSDKHREELSIVDFFLAGETNWGPAFVRLCNAAILQKKRAVLPTGEYPITTLSTVNMANGDFLEIDARGSTLVLSGGDWEQLEIKNETAANGCTVRISNLNLRGEGHVAATHWGVATETYPKNIALLISAQNIDVFNVSVSDIWGKGLNFGYYTNVTVNKVRFSNVGGHSYTYAADAYGNEDSFGDALYFNRVSGAAKVRINDFYAQGMESSAVPSSAGGGLSRAAICFEFDAPDASSLDVDITNFTCSNFERDLHFEDTVNASLTIHGARVSNTAVMVHTYLSNVSALIDDLTYSANQNVTFAGDSFFFHQLTAIIKNSTFYNPTKAWDGTTANVPSGANLTLNDCHLYYNDARHHGKNSATTFNDCHIYDYNGDASNATMEVHYNRTLFSTTTPATFGNVLSESSGAETFYRCDFSGQQPSIFKTVQMATYRDDYGNASGSCLRINNATTDMPKVLNAIYRVIELDTGVTRIGYVTDTGSVYSPGAVAAIQAGSTPSTIRCGAGVTFSAFVEILQHPKV